MPAQTTKSDALLSYIKTLSIAEGREVAAYARRLHATGLPVPTLDMIKDFVVVLREQKRTPQYLQGDGFDYLERA